MAVQWPSDLWQPPVTDPDTDQYRCARDKAVEHVFNLPQGRPIVAVSGSGKSHQYSSQSKELGKTLARLGVTMTSGGLDGVMFDVTEGFIHSGGFFARFFGKNKKIASRAIRIIPKGKEPQAEELGKRLSGATSVYTDLPADDSYNRHKGPSSRNHVLIATADAVICMPGDDGSIAEAELAINVYKKPVIAYVPGAGSNTKWHMAITSCCIPVCTKKDALEAWLKSKLF
jgi:predicted Rossmann-fold nucleotide-binding protein